MTTQYQWKFTDGQFAALFPSKGKAALPIGLTPPAPGEPFYLYLGQPDSVVQVEIFNTHRQFKVDSPPAVAQIPRRWPVPRHGLRGGAGRLPLVWR